MNQPQAVVTGASRGIGLAISERLTAMGMAVTGVARSFPHDGPWARTVARDLADLDGIEDFAVKLAADHPDLAVLVLNAGEGRFKSLESLSWQEIRHLLDLNLVSQIALARAAVPPMKRRGVGDIVVIGSEAAIRPGRKGTVYGAAKAGLRGFAQALRLECANRGVRVSLVNPGMTDTAFYDGLGFAPGREDDQHIRAGDVAQAVAMIIGAPPGTVFDEINLSPANRVIDFSPGR